MQTPSPKFKGKPTEGKTPLTGDEKGGIAQLVANTSSVQRFSRIPLDDVTNSASTSVREQKSQPLPGFSPEEDQDQPHPPPRRKEGGGKQPPKLRKRPAVALFTRLSGLDAPESTGDVSINLTPPASSLYSAPPFNNVVLQERFRNYDEFLRVQAELSDSQAYISCLEAERKDVHGLLETERSERLKDYTTWQQEDYKGRVDLFNLADVLFQCFFPPEAQVPTVAKFWGGVQSIVKVSFKKNLEVSFEFSYYPAV